MRKAGQCGAALPTWARPGRLRVAASLWLALTPGCGCVSSSHRVAPLLGPLVETTNTRSGRLPAVCPVSKQAESDEAPQRIAPEERVPEFLLASEDCAIYDSRELVGKRPFAVIFFASWCTVCDHKMPLIREALGQRGDQLTTLFVSLDEADGWAETEAFLGRHGVAATSAVRGRDFLGFSLGYNPFRSVPVVVVVGRSGRVVDVQVGVRDGDASRLVRALDIAIDESPERPRLTSVLPP